MNVGQGSPSKGSRGTALSCRGALCALLAMLLLLAMTKPSHGFQQPTGNALDVEFRVVWGGASPRQFEGSIGISQGSLQLERNLSLEAESIGKIRRHGPAALKVLAHQPSTFGGADIRVKCPLTASLSFRFKEPQSGNMKELLVSVAELLSTDWQEVIDDKGSRLAVSRLVQDKLRIGFPSASAILAPGTTRAATVEGVRTGLPAGRYVLKLFIEDSNSSSLAKSFSVSINDSGNFEPQSIDFTAPNEEGAYSLCVLIAQAKLFSPLNPLPSESLERNLDFVVFDQSKSAETIAGWLSVAGINALDASKPGYFSWLTPISEPISYSLTPLTRTLEPVTPQAGIDLLTGWKAINPLSGSLQQPLSYGALGSRPMPSTNSQQPVECLTIGTNAWLAIPMQDLEPGVPHRLRIRTPQDQSQKLVVSVKSTQSSAGRVRVGNDYLLEVPQRATSLGSLQETEIVFWPNSTEMFIVLSNASDQWDASVFDVFVDRAQLAETPADAKEDERLVGIYLDKPLLADFFASELRADSVTNRELEDWSTWQSAMKRLCQYAEYSQANLLVLKVQSDGGAIFESKSLSPSRRYDGGAFFTDGRSPEIKDAVALLLKYAERFGTKVVLSLEFSSPLVALANSETRPGVFQMQLAQDEVSSRFYNPLHPTVQSEVENAIEEIVNRYGDSKALAGIQLDLAGNSPLTFAGDLWGFDSNTLINYQRAIQANLPKDASQRLQLLAGPGRIPFLQWRAQELGKFYEKLAKPIMDSGTGRRLYLNALPLWEEVPNESRFVNPEAILRNPGELLLARGLDVASIQGIPGLVLLQGETFETVPVSDPQTWVLSESRQQRRSLKGAKGALVVERPMVHMLSQVDANQRWYEGSRFPETLYPINVRTGVAANQRLIEQVFASDIDWLAVGSWLPITHPSEQSRAIYRTLRALPDEQMREFPTNSDKVNVKVRTLYRETESVLQVVNNSPWPELVSLQIQFDGETPKVESLGGNARNIRQGKSWALGQSNGQILEFEIGAFDLVGLKIEGTENFRLRDVKHTPPPETVEFISAELQAFEEVIGRAADPSQQRKLAHLFGDFEQWNDAGEPVGWTVSSLPNVQIARANELPRIGSSSLRISNRNEGSVSAWIQSSAIPLPGTGRLVLQAWLRAPPRQGDVRVRLSVLGRQKDGSRFERAIEVGDLKTSPISNDWGSRPFSLHVNDLPSEQLSEVFVAVEVVGEGTVWVDDVEVLETWLLPNEKIYLQGMMFVAKQELTEDNPYPAEKLLAGHWGTYFAAFETRTRQTPLATPVVSNQPDQQSPKKTSSNWFPRPKVFQQLRDSMFSPWQR